MDLIASILVLIQHIIIGTIGSFGNTIVLLVYIKRLNDNELSTLFILYLAITDLSCCLILVPLNCYVELFDSKIQSDLLCKFHTFLSISNITFSCFLMTLVAFERYFSIICPARKIINKMRSQILTSILLALCLIIAIVGSLGVGIDHKVVLNDINFTRIDFITDFDNDNNNISDVWMRTYDCFHNDAIIKRDALAYIRLLQNLLPVICFFIIFYLYAAIYKNASKHRTMKRNRDTFYKKIINRSRNLNGFYNQNKINDFGEQEKVKVKEEASKLVLLMNDITSVGNDEMKNSSSSTTARTTIMCLESNDFFVEKNKNFGELRSFKVSRTSMANLRTAFMLFIVTLIMSIVFMPALLISFNLIPFNPIYWNLYFINNASNPIIYSFLNAKFRNSLSHFLCRSFIFKRKCRV
jgi:hypothetical protein